MGSRRFRDHFEGDGAGYLSVAGTKRLDRLIVSAAADSGMADGLTSPGCRPMTRSGGWSDRQQLRLERHLKPGAELLFAPATLHREPVVEARVDENPDDVAGGSIVDVGAQGAFGAQEPYEAAGSLESLPLDLSPERAHLEVTDAGGPEDLVDGGRRSPISAIMPA